MANKWYNQVKKIASDLLKTPQDNIHSIGNANYYLALLHQFGNGGYPRDLLSAKQFYTLASKTYCVYSEQIPLRLAEIQSEIARESTTITAVIAPTAKHYRGLIGKNLKDDRNKSPATLSLKTFSTLKKSDADDKFRDDPSGPEPQKEPALTNQSSGQMLLDFAVRFTDLTFGDLLGQGAYGKVFAGEWQFNTVAIKQYAAQDFSEQTKNEILKEAKVMATASTQSDYLVRLRGIVLEKPHYSLVMEYMPGGDLFHLLKSSQELTWTMRYRISLDMTIGLHHLHQRSILHRDLKSLNVLLDMNFRAKLADFGLSTLKLSSASTTAGGLKGTPRWLSPELFKRGAKATTASDLYALAMIFWELITRQIPFADAPNQEVAIALD